MITSRAGKELIKHFESFRSQAYKCPAGVWTIGYGTTVIAGRPVFSGETCTEIQASEYLANDLRVFEAAVAGAVRVPLYQHQFDALVCFAYNVGVGALSSSTLLRNINASIPVIEKRFTDWNKATIKNVLTALPGLTRRRKAEFYLFSTGQIKTIF